MTVRRDFPTIDEVAIGALLHDVGKLYQRAVGSLETMPQQVRNRASVVLPGWQGKSSHWHALWTDAFFTELVDANPFPDALDRRWVRDCAVFHHRPLSNDDPNARFGAVTRLVSEADRVASAMERKPKDAEQDAETSGLGRHAYRRTQLTSLFAAIAIHKATPPRDLRQPLRALSAEALTPRAGPAEDAALPQAYADLWTAFAKGYRDVAARAGDDVTAFHEGLLALSETVMWAIPSSTMDDPDVGLHDHARGVAAAAACLFAHHAHAGSLADQTAIEDRTTPKLRFIAGDLSGIQTALFRLASEGASGLARVLRGRSLRFQLIAEAAARVCLATFGLPPACVLQNAGGRFLILAPLTDDARQRADLDQARSDIDRWMRDQYQGDLALNIAMTAPVSSGDLIDASKSGKVYDGVAIAVEDAKQAPLRGAREAVFAGRWDAGLGVCATCGVRPAMVAGDDARPRCPACDAETRLGRLYPRARAVVMDRRIGGARRPADRIFDIETDLPATPAPHGGAHGWRFRGAGIADGLPLAERFAGAHVPVHDAATLANPLLTQARRDSGDDAAADAGDALTFAELAALSCEGGKGRPMLAALKADVDRLGQIFTRGLGARRSLARTAALSRMMDAFFTGFLPHRLKTAFPHVYTVYAGGDDLLLLGPWRDVLALAKALREDFSDFVGGSKHVTLSAGIALFAPKTPVSLAAREAEARLDKAKRDGRDAHHRLTGDLQSAQLDKAKRDGCDRVHLVLKHDAPALSWTQYADALAASERLHGLVNDAASDVTTALLYKLLWLDDRRIACAGGDPSAADWMAKLGYVVWRTLGGDRHAQTRAFILSLLGLKPDMTRFGAETAPAARVALTIAIYRNR